MNSYHNSNYVGLSAIVDDLFDKNLAQLELEGAAAAAGDPAPAPLANPLSFSSVNLITNTASGYGPTPYHAPTPSYSSYTIPAYSSYTAPTPSYSSYTAPTPSYSPYYAPKPKYSYSAPSYKPHTSYSKPTTSYAVNISGDSGLG